MKIVVVGSGGPGSSHGLALIDDQPVKIILKRFDAFPAGVDVLAGVEARSIDREKQRLLLKSGDALKYERMAGTLREVASSNAVPVNTAKETFMKVLNAVAVVLLSSVFASAHAQAPSDPQIAGIVVVANQIDVDAGKLAKRRAKNKEVAAFAQRMITDHTAVNKQAAALAKRLNVKPEESDTSKSLRAGAEDNMANLRGLKGAAFDKAYVDHEVAYHQAVLDAIDKVLIPGARNAELKDLIVKVRPAIAAHLEHAKMLQGSLGRS